MRRAFKIGGIGCGGLLVLIIAIAVISAAVGHKSASPATTSTTTTTTGHHAPKTLAHARLAQLVRDERGWNRANVRWGSAVVRCFHTSPSAMASCTGQAYAAWQASFSRATHDVRVMARPINGKCKFRLLNYLGMGGHGAYYVEVMGFAEKDASKGEVSQYDLDIKYLVNTTWRLLFRNARAAANACS